MITAFRWTLVAVLAGHGLIHFLGAAKGFGWADIPQLTQPISVLAGVLWLLAATLVLSTAVLLAVGAPTWWWALALVAAAVSQVAVVTSWSDARVGTIVNLVLVLAAGLAFATDGPASFHAEYRKQAARALTEVDPSPAIVHESDLDVLPGPLAVSSRWR